MLKKSNINTFPLSKKTKHFVWMETWKLFEEQATIWQTVSHPSDVSGTAVSAQGKKNSPPRPDAKQHHAGRKGQSHHQWVSVYNTDKIKMAATYPLPPTVQNEARFLSWAPILPPSHSVVIAAKAVFSIFTASNNYQTKLMCKKDANWQELVKNTDTIFERNALVFSSAHFPIYSHGGGPKTTVRNCYFTSSTLTYCMYHSYDPY